MTSKQNTNKWGWFSLESCVVCAKPMNDFIMDGWKCAICHGYVHADCHNYVWHWFLTRDALEVLAALQ